MNDFTLENKIIELSDSFESENMRTREEILEVYEVQRTNSNDVRVDETLMPYKDLLD